MKKVTCIRIQFQFIAKGVSVMTNTNKPQFAIQVKLRPNTTAKTLCRELLCRIGDQDCGETSELNLMTRRLINFLRSSGVKELRLNKFHRCYGNKFNSRQTEDLLKFIVTNCNLNLLISMPPRYREELESNEQFVRKIRYV